MLAVTELTALSAANAAISVAVGANANISLNATPSTHTESFTYTSSDPTVATVNESGKITGVKAGNTTIVVQSSRTHKVVGIAVTVTAAA